MCARMVFQILSKLSRLEPRHSESALAFSRKAFALLVCVFARNVFDGLTLSPGAIRLSGSLFSTPVVGRFSLPHPIIHAQHALLGRCGSSPRQSERVSCTLHNRSSRECPRTLLPLRGY